MCLRMLRAPSSFRRVGASARDGGKGGHSSYRIKFECAAAPLHSSTPSVVRQPGQPGVAGWTPDRWPTRLGRATGQPSALDEHAPANREDGGSDGKAQRAQDEQPPPLDHRRRKQLGVASQEGEHGAGALPGGVVDDREHEEQCRAHGAHHHLADGASECEPYV